MKESGNETFSDALRVWKENSRGPAKAGCISHGCMCWELLYLCSLYLAELSGFVWDVRSFRILQLTNSLSAKVQLWCVGSFHQLKGLLSAAAAFMIERSELGVNAKSPRCFFVVVVAPESKLFRAGFVSANALPYLSAEWCLSCWPQLTRRIVLKERDRSRDGVWEQDNRLGTVTKCYVPLTHTRRVPSVSTSQSCVP